MPRKISLKNLVDMLWGIKKVHPEQKRPDFREDKNKGYIKLI